jgi:hypothetical protein
MRAGAVPVNSSKWMTRDHAMNIPLIRKERGSRDWRSTCHD